MVFNLHQVSGIGEWEEGVEKDLRVFRVPGGKVFLVVRKGTIEVRTDGELSELLRSQYESVMESRYFGRGGIEIVLSGQLGDDEINDLVRLSYNLTVE